MSTQNMSSVVFVLSNTTNMFAHLTKLFYIDLCIVDISKVSLQLSNSLRPPTSYNSFVSTSPKHFINNGSVVNI